MNGFMDIINNLDLPALRGRIASAAAADVERALSHEHLAESDLPALFSPAAAPYLETLAQRAAALTERRFGRVIQLYTPLYLSNECINKCVYCGLSHELEIPRLSLSPQQVRAEAQILYDEGFRHILLVSGESRRHVNLPYLLEVVRLLHGRFDSIAIEINPQTAEEYRALAAAGVDGLTLYQETYDPQLYKAYHLSGPKKLYHKRIEAMEHGGAAGFRSLGIGALLGLNEWRFEALMTALHGRWLTRRFWRSRVAVSFPRIRHAAGEFSPPRPMGDAELVQMICAMRLALPDAELVLSTREPAALRDRLVGLGITRMSAGSKTQPGGYGDPAAGGEQFEVEDKRAPEAISAMLKARGFDPVWKDFDREFIPAAG